MSREIILLIIQDIAAVAFLVQADDDETGPVSCYYYHAGYLGSTMIHPLLQFNPYAYGVLTGSALHGVGHVVSAAMVGGKVGADIAILVKLGVSGAIIPCSPGNGLPF